MALNKIKTELLVRSNNPNLQLRFADNSLVPTTEVVKYLGSMITWSHPFDMAFKHRAALAEEAYKKLRPIWNSSLPKPTKIKIFQSTFVPILRYGLDALTLTTPHLKRIDAFYIRSLRSLIGIKASFYARIPNTDVYSQARRPKLPSQSLSDTQFKMMQEVFLSDMSEISQSVVFNAAYKDRIHNQGRRRGMQFPCWVEVVSKQYFPDIYHSPDHTAFGPSKYASIVRVLRNPLLGRRQSAPTRAHGPSKKKIFTLNPGVGMLEKAISGA